MAMKQSWAREVLGRGAWVAWACALATLAAAVAPAGAAELRKVSFTINSRVLPPGIANLWVGDHLGYFKEEGLQPDWLTSEGAGQTIQLLLAGRIDMTVGVQDPLLLRAAKGEDFPLVMIYNYNRGVVYQLAVKPDSPIRHASELKGKRIGVLSLGHPGMIYAKVVLKDAGLDPEKDIEFLAVGQGATAGRALYDVKVDALAYWDFHWLQVETLGMPVRTLAQPPFIQRIQAGHAITVRRDFLQRNRKELGGFLRGVARGTAFALENPDAAAWIHFQMFPGTKPKGLEEEVTISRAAAELRVRGPLLQRDIGPSRLFGEFIPEAWAAYAKFLGVEGVSPAKYYTNELIAEANQFDPEPIRQAARTFRRR